METDFSNTSNQNALTSALPPATGSSNINLTPSERVVSTFGGAALAVVGLRHLGSLSGITMFVSGGYLLARGLSGYCAITNAINNRDSRQASAMELSSTFTINKPKNDVYSFWRKLENLPRFMQHLDSVEELDDKRSKWTAKLPGGVGKVSWEAEIQNDISGEVISWSSLPGSTVDNAGEVRFKDAATGSDSTEISVRLTYRLPAGDLGSIAAKLFNPAVEKMMREDIRSFKRLMETGESASTREYDSNRFNESYGRASSERQSPTPGTDQSKSEVGKKSDTGKKPYTSNIK
jgi:uncharacterized membrane protein